MIDDIRTDKIALRTSVTESLERLLSQNYISRNGDTYAFLTDEEQDIAIDIRNTVVDSAQVTASIAQTVFGEIYPAKKFKYGKYDFAYDQYVDETLNGSASGGMRLRIVTVASDYYGAPDQRLIMDSQVNNEAIVVLSNETPYFEELEQAMKIRKYVKQRNVSQLRRAFRILSANGSSKLAPLKSVRVAISRKPLWAQRLSSTVRSWTSRPVMRKDKLDAALNGLVESVYSKLGMVNKFVESDADILAILNGTDNEQGAFAGTGSNNEDALNEISQWLELQNAKMLTTSMGDVQRRYSAIPYGWRELTLPLWLPVLLPSRKSQSSMAARLWARTSEGWWTICANGQRLIRRL